MRNELKILDNAFNELDNEIDTHRKDPDVTMVHQIFSLPDKKKVNDIGQYICKIIDECLKDFEAENFKSLMNYRCQIKWVQEKMASLRIEVERHLQLKTKRRDPDYLLSVLAELA